MAKNNVCGEHCEIAHAVLGDGKSNEGLVQDLKDLKDEFNKFKWMAAGAWLGTGMVVSAVKVILSF